MVDTCDCCKGIERLTPQATANRPGLRALTYRVGTHATFLETMKARLSSLYIDVPREEKDEFGQPKFDRIYPLHKLRTRAQDDPAIALLDAWALLGAVLTFYQERIANEGYLMTAVERRSILELARLIGYELRPGVSASVFLAYTLDEKTTEPVIIPVGAKSQSVPGPGELPQTFETGEPLEARAAWNNLAPRQARPQTKATIQTVNAMRVYLKGISTNLKASDPLLIDFGDGTRELYRVVDVAPDSLLDHTLVRFQDWRAAPTLADKVRVSLQAVVSALRDTASLKKSTAKSEFVARLQDMAAKVEKRAAVSNDAELGALHEKTLSNLEHELQVANDDVKFKNVKAWLAPIVENLRVDAATNMVKGMAAGTGNAASIGDTTTAAAKGAGVADVISKLTLPASVPPRSTNFLTRAPDKVFTANADIGNQVLTSLQPNLHRTLAPALSGGKATGDNQIHVYALRAKAGLFGGNLPRLPIYTRGEDGTVTITGYEPALDLNSAWRGLVNKLAPLPVIALDVENDKLQAGGWAVLDFPIPGFDDVTGALVAGTREIAPLKISAARATVMPIKGNSTRSTQLAVTPAWFEGWETPRIRLMLSSSEVLTDSVVYAQSEELALADEPMPSELCGGQENWIELDEWYADLKSGRWAIVSGERADILDAFGKPVPGIKVSELVMLAEVIQDVSNQDGEPLTRGKSDNQFPDEKLHTFVRFAKTLSYCYQRDTVKIYGNVVKATHGETRKEVLGSGDGSQALQSFTLRQPPLTFVAAPNPRGVTSTLQVYVNDVQWHETNSLAALAPKDRKFITRANDDAQTTIIFGNGEHGARLPTGRENVRAMYRNGIGKGGNVNAEQISLLMTRPLGVKEVINPLRASGGADKENRDQARENAPLAVTALDRLVSMQDYADFARTFAGIGKAAAARLVYAQREIVHVTIAGADDIPIEPTSDLYRNLMLALRQYGDPFQPFRVELRELILLVISANVRIAADYQWDKVAANIRARLLDTFSFERRALAQGVALSEITSAIQNVPGVAYVDVDLFAGIHEKKTENGVRRLKTPNEITDEIKQYVAQRESEKNLPDVQKKNPQRQVFAASAGLDHGALRPAELAILTPQVPDTLILNSIG